MLSPEAMFGADKEKPCVRQVFGISGTGKSVFLRETLRSAARSPKFGELHRFLVFDIKHDGYESLAPPSKSATEALRRVDKDRLVVIHPQMETADMELDQVIEWMFDTAQSVDDFSATLIIEESSTFIGASMGSIPASVKRFATQGRSLGLSLILVNQRALSNKWTDTQSASITCFRLAHPDRDLLRKRWGIDADSMDFRLKERKFSFGHLDLESLDLSYFAPIEMPKNPRPVVERKSRLTRFIEAFG
jgi:DNA helicase HerA-like ATPase